MPCHCADVIAQQRSCEVCALLELILLASAGSRQASAASGPADWPPSGLLALAKGLQRSLLGAGWADALLQGAEGQRADELVRPCVLPGRLPHGQDAASRPGLHLLCSLTWTCNFAV